MSDAWDTLDAGHAWHAEVPTIQQRQVGDFVHGEIQGPPWEGGFFPVKCGALKGQPQSLKLDSF